MTRWLPREQLQARLDELDRLIAVDDPTGDLRFERAVTLTGLGRDLDARTAYLDLLAVRPTDFATLNNLGMLLESMGYRSAAQSVFFEAIKHHPGNAMARINLGDSLRRSRAIAEAREQYEAALRLAPGHPDAHRGMAYLLTGLGEEEAARPHREKAFRDRPTLFYPYRGDGSPIDLLLLASALGGAVPIRQHIDDRIFATTVLFVEFHHPGAPLPPHQVIFNAIGDADLSAAALEAAERLLARTTAPVINRPDAVRVTGRVDNARRLAGIPGLIAPKMTLLRRDSQAEAPALLAGHGIFYPCLLRSPGFHTGENFVRVERPEDLAAAIGSLPGEELIAIEYLDASGIDGKIRKYRVMMIDGRIHPVHAAVSHDWKVHYFTADMAGNEAHRAEDERFLTDMEGVLGPGRLAVLERITAALGLDYAGIDFGLDRTGNLLLFEANATVVINPPDSDPRWDFRRAPVQRVLDAIRTLLLDRAAAALNQRLAEASASFDSGDMAGCAAICEEALSHFSRAPALLHLLGLTRLRLGQREAALNLLERALALNAGAAPPFASGRAPQR